MKTQVWTILLALSLLFEANVLLADQNKASNFKDKARRSQQAGDFTKADLYYAQAMKESPNDVGISMSTVELYIQQHRYSDAEKLIQTADQNDYRTWKMKSALYLAKNEEQSSIEALQKSFALGGRKDPYVLTRLQIYYEQTNNLEQKVEAENLLESLRVKKNDKK